MSKKILLVEDEAKIAHMVKKILEMDGFEVVIVHDGRKGLQLAKNGNFDLIILDYMLPNLNGLEVCKELRLEGARIPIVMLTARETIEDRMAAFDAGANEYLSKPFSFEDLLLKINALLDGSQKKPKRKSQKIKKYSFDIYQYNQKILDNLPVSIVTIDKNGNMTSANKYYSYLSKRNFIPNNNVFTGKFFIRENLVNDYRKLLRDGTVVKRDHCFERNVNGEDKYLKIIAVPFLDKQGNIEGALSMALDDTESAQLNNKLRLLNEELEKKVEMRTKQLDETNKELERVMQLKAMFVADVSHEMKTSLAIMQGYIELIARGLIEEDEKNETYASVFNEIKRSSEMLSDMAMLTDATSLEQNLNFETIDLNHLIADTCKSFKVVADDKRIEICHLNPRKKVEISGDILHIERLVSNLIGNAIKYNKPDGKVEVSAKKNKDSIVFTVRDTGIGISEEHMPFIFERFYRADKSRKRIDDGSGLGLAICKWVTELHGGLISVNSIEGKGSEFVVRLPQRVAMELAEN